MFYCLSGCVWHAVYSLVNDQCLCFSSFFANELALRMPGHKFKSFISTSPCAGGSTQDLQQHMSADGSTQLTVTHVS